MIKYLKNQYMKYKAKKIIEKTNEINIIVCSGKIKEAKNKYHDLINNYKEFSLSTQLDLVITSFHIDFLNSNFSEVIEKNQYLLEEIEKNTSYSVKYKEYFKGFILNLTIISALFLDNRKLADQLKKKFFTLQINLNDKEYYIFESTYPIYDNETLSKVFEREEYYQYSKDFLAKIIEYEKQFNNEIKNV